MASNAQQEAAKADAKITLYWLEKSRSHRILWLLEELSLPYTLSIHARNPSTGLAPPDLKAIHPLGKSPVITIGSTSSPETPPRIIAESGAIVEYLCDHFGQELVPARWREGREGMVGGESEEWMRWRFFMHYAEGSMMPFLVMQLIANRIKSSPVPFFIRPITNRIASTLESSFIHPNLLTAFTFLEDQLATSPSDGDFLCGAKLTGADILMVFPLEAALGRGGLTKEKFPRLVRYVDALRGREAYVRAVDRIKEETGGYETVS